MVLALMTQISCARQHDFTSADEWAIRMAEESSLSSAIQRVAKAETPRLLFESLGKGRFHLEI